MEVFYFFFHSKRNWILNTILLNIWYQTDNCVSSRFFVWELAQGVRSGSPRYHRMLQRAVQVCAACEVDAGGCWCRLGEKTRWLPAGKKLSVKYRVDISIFVYMTTSAGKVITKIRLAFSLSVTLKERHLRLCFTFLILDFQKSKKVLWSLLNSYLYHS
jgi:hypothetical protein